MFSCEICEICRKTFLAEHQRTIASDYSRKRWLCFCSQSKSSDLKIYKLKNSLSPLIVTGLFEQRNKLYDDLRKNSQFTIPPIRTVYDGSESISFLGPKIWNILPDRLENANSIEALKMQIKKWKPKNCPCRLCKVYVKNVGFV